MAQSGDANLPNELRELEQRLLSARPSFTELELDQLKVRAMTSASGAGPTGSGRKRGTPMRSRALTLAVAALLIGGTTGGAIAAGSGGGGGNAASAQYKPGNGCGDKNHTHTGPPGNPSNHKCPPQSQSSQSQSSQSQSSQSSHSHGRHSHSRHSHRQH
jgi:hypothetical protein